MGIDTFGDKVQFTNSGTYTNFKDAHNMLNAFLDKELYENI